jgi:hypothetical protein
MKQLENRISKALASAGKQRRVQNTPGAKSLKRGAQRKPPQTSVITSVNIPVETAYTVSQNTNRQIHTERASEYIGTVTFLPTGTPGEFVQFMMSPLAWPNTRLARLAANYQKYRFRKICLKMQSSTTTAVNGLFVVGYNSNPDAELSIVNSIPFIYDLPGAQSTNFWRTVTSFAQIEDPNKWYNLDLDSSEIMQTTQGYFAVALQVPPNSTGAVTFPVILDYEVQLTGPALNPINTIGVAVFPSGNFGYNSVTGNFTFVQDTGEPSPPSLSSGQPYLLNPMYNVPTQDGQGNLLFESPQIIVPTSLSWSWYQTLDAFKQASPLFVNSSFHAPRTTISPVVGN